MNKRIRRKVAKRINSKIMNYERLTEFEIKHSFISKKIWNRVVNKKHELDKFPISIDLAEGPDTTVHSVIQVGGRNLVVSGTGQLIGEDTIEKYFKEKGCSDEEFAGLAGNLFVEPTEVERFQSAIDVMNNFGKQNNPEPSVDRVEEPNKWNKLKGKVKGWFGK